MSRREVASGGGYHRILYVPLILSALIQHPAFREESGFRLAAMGVWLLYALFAAAKSVGDIRFRVSRGMQLAFALYAWYVCYCAANQLLRGGAGYFLDVFFYSMSLTLFSFTVGYLSSFCIRREGMTKACLVYGVAAAVASIHAVANSQEFVSKNAVGPAMVCSIILLGYCSSAAGTWLKPILYVLIAGLACSVVMTANRSSMVSMLVLSVYFLSSRKSGFGRKSLLLCAIIVAAYVIATNDSRRDLVEEKVGTQRLDRGVDAFTGGRVSQSQRGMETFMDNPLFGVGPCYVENCPLSLLAQFGLVGAIPFFLVWGMLLRRYTFGGCVGDDILEKSLGMLLLHGTVISFAEEFAPLGSGFTYLSLWLILGYVVGSRSFRMRYDWERSNQCPQAFS